MDYGGPVELVDQLISSVADIMTPNTDQLGGETKPGDSSPALVSTLDDSDSDEEAAETWQGAEVKTTAGCPARYCEPIKVSRSQLTNIPAISPSRPLQVDSQVLRMILCQDRWYFVLVSATAQSLSRLSMSACLVMTSKVCSKKPLVIP